MPVINKGRYTVYLDKQNVDEIRRYLSKKPHAGGLSELLDKHVTRCADLIRKNPKALNEIEDGKMTVRKFVKLAMLDF